jgi:hypothetical protein
MDEKFLETYNRYYPNVVITGNYPPNFSIKNIPTKTINDLKTIFYYSGGLPRISSTPLATSSLYNRAPYMYVGNIATLQ